MAHDIVSASPSYVRRAWWTVLGCGACEVLAGMSFVVWEIFRGPTTDPAGIVQDDGGYFLGIPLLVGALVAIGLLVVGRRPDAIALVALAAAATALPLLLGLWATLAGFLDLTPLWAG